MNKKVKTSLIIIGVIIGLLFFWYLASPLFLNKVVDEEFPMGTGNNSDVLESMVLHEGDFMDADSFHKTSGNVQILSDSENTYIRFEDFETTNGPDLYVYLAEDLNADSFVDLGKLKGNIGNQNYEINEEVDFSDYNYVLIWCKRFSVLFGSAEIK